MPTQMIPDTNTSNPFSLDTSETARHRRLQTALQTLRENKRLRDKLVEGDQEVVRIARLKVAGIALKTERREGRYL